jgi:CRISPR-associated protein Csh2
MEIFKNRAYGFVVIKSINSNYNADFSGQPRTLPNGSVYATDKALKYMVRHFIENNYPNKKVFYYKRLNKKHNPISLNEAYIKMFGNFPTVKLKTKIVVDKKVVANNLLSCIDVRLFGATFAGETNVSIHGPVQINHGLNIWHENNIFSEQITSPFSNKSDDPEAEKGMTTIGRQSKLEEGHYVHHYSINPKNIEGIISNGENGSQTLTQNDVSILKETLRKGATYYDSAAKAGTENEILFYVELKEDSKLVLPNFTEMIRMSDSKENGKRYFNLELIKDELLKYSDNIKKCEIYYDSNIIEVINLPNNSMEYDLNNPDHS